MSPLAAALFALGPEVRYVATLRGGKLDLHQREGISGASAAESDRYEELLVNPTVKEILSRRGAIDCGGLDYVLIRYGHFFQLVVPVADGHVSVAFETTAELPAMLRAVAVVRGGAAA